MFCRVPLENELKYSFRIKYKLDTPGEYCTCMGWKHLVSEEKSYSSVQSNFFKWYLLQPFNFSLLLSGSPLCFCTTAQPQFQLKRTGCISACASPYIILHGCSVASVSHEYFKGIYTDSIKGASSCQSFRPAACLSLSKAGSYGEPWTHWTGKRFTSPHTKQWQRMKIYVTIYDKKTGWQIRADVKNRQLYLSIVSSVSEKQIT